MKNLFRNLINGSFLIVCAYGLFVVISLMLQCFIPFMQTFGNLMQLQWLAPFLNQSFVLPMDIITGIWTAIAAGYVGLDRGMFMLDGWKNGQKIEAFTETKRKQLVQIIVLTFVTYGVAVILNVLFNSNLSLAPLATAFGSTVLCYVLGNKAIGAGQKLHPDEDLDGDGIKDEDQYSKDELIKLRQKYADLKSISCPHSKDCIVGNNMTTEQHDVLMEIVKELQKGKQVSMILAGNKIIYKSYDRNLDNKTVTVIKQ